MGKTKNSRYKKNEHGTHATDKPKMSFLQNLTLFFVIIFVIIVFLFFILPPISFKEEESIRNTTAGYNLADETVFENADYLTSKNLKIEFDNGVYKVIASIYNSSQEIAKNLKCKYVLLDRNDNVVYNLDVSIARVKPNEQSSFSAILDIDLSSVTHYTVSLDF